MLIVVQLFRVAAVERVLARLEVSSIEHIRHVLCRMVKAERHQTATCTALVSRLQLRLADDDATAQRRTTCNCDVVFRRPH